MLFILAFIIISIVEISLLIEVGQHIGGVATFFLMLATTVLGVALVRLQGLRMLHKVQAQLLQGEKPSETVLSGAMLFFAGVLFVLPGFFTDFIALVLLIPPVRRFSALWLLKQSRHLGPIQGMRGFYFHSRTSAGPTFGQASQNKTGSGRVVEGEYEEKKEPSAEKEQSQSRIEKK